MKLKTTFADTRDKPKSMRKEQVDAIKNIEDFVKRTDKDVLMKLLIKHSNPVTGGIRLKYLI